MVCFRYSTSVYLLVLAISDTLALWTFLPESTFRFLLDLNYLNLSIIHCKTVTWLAYASGAVSTWTVAHLTIERSLMTIFPIKAKTKLTPRVSLFVSLSTVFVAQLFTLHLVFGHKMAESSLEKITENGTSTEIIIKCKLVSEEYRKFMYFTWNYIVLICFNLLPMAIVISGNVIIGYVLCKRKRKVFPTVNLNQLNMAREKMAVKMLFAISCFFIFSTSPYCLYAVIQNAFWDQKMTAKDKAVDQLINAIVHMLLFSNFTFNFVMYFARGTLFRQEWNKIVASVESRIAEVQQRWRRTNKTGAIKAINVTV